MRLRTCCCSVRAALCALSLTHTRTQAPTISRPFILSPSPLLHARTTAKAYQLNPASVNETLYLQVLIKALTRLAEPTPAHDFVLLSAVLPLGLHADARFAQLQALKTNLDRAEFPQFWTGVEASQDLFDSVPGAIGAFRGYVATVAREVPFSAIQFPIYEVSDLASVLLFYLLFWGLIFAVRAGFSLLTLLILKDNIF